MHILYSKRHAESHRLWNALSLKVAMKFKKTVKFIFFFIYLFLALTANQE